MKTAAAIDTGKARALIKGAIAGAIRLMLLDGRLDEPLRIQVKPNFNTACWSWQSGVHRVFVGEGALERSKHGLSDAELERYAHSYMHHERAHAMFTERDPAVLRGWLASFEVPFGLMNLVEDARVEHRYRATSEDGFRFHWTRYEKTDASGPIVGCSQGDSFGWAFFRLIQAEGQPVDWSEATVERPDVFQEAERYYSRAVQLDSTKAAVELAAEIVARYPELAGMTGRCGMEVGASMSGADGKTALETFEQDAEEDQQSPAAKSPGSQGTGSGGSAVGEELMGEPGSIELDVARVRRLASRLSMLRGASRDARRYETKPAKRVSVRHALQGQARWVRRVEVAGQNKLRRLLVVVDVSGSMDGRPLEAAAHLIAGLSACAQAGELEGDVVLSTTGEKGSAWMRKPLPWTMEEARSLISHDTEGLAQTLRENDELVVEADETYVMTDGHIGGPRIPHEAYRRRGLRVTGLYCNEDRDDLESVHEQMQQHFQRYVVRNTIESLVEGLVLD